MRKPAIAILFVVVVAALIGVRGAEPARAAILTFTGKGSYTVPPGVTAIILDVYGGQGGRGSEASALGGKVERCTVCSRLPPANGSRCTRVGRAALARCAPAAWASTPTVGATVAPTVAAPSTRTATGAEAEGRRWWSEEPGAPPR
jgi:hypothetical protein